MGTADPNLDHSYLPARSKTKNNKSCIIMLIKLHFVSVLFTVNTYLHFLHFIVYIEIQDS